MLQKLSNKLNNILNLPLILFRLLIEIKRQKRFIKNNLLPLLNEFQKESNSNLSDTEFKKITGYYGFAIPVFFGHGYSILRAKKLSIRERRALTYLAVLTSLYDDFFDKYNLSDYHIWELTTNPNLGIANSIHEFLFVKFYKLVLENSSNPELFKKRVEGVYKTQIESKKQINSSLSEDEIYSITMDKGGASLLCIRSSMETKADPNEEDFLSSFGGLLQLENDIFDFYKDYKSNISTLATNTKSIFELREKYNNLYNKTLQLLDKTDFPKKNIAYFKRFISLIIHRASVCLDCLERNEKLTNGKFQLENYERNQLICDMEKTGNILKVIKYYINDK